jgi:hypothetical protein
VQGKAMLSRTNAAILPDTGTMRTRLAQVLLAAVMAAAFGCGVADAQTAPKPAVAAATPIADPVPNPSIPLPRPRPKMGLLPSWIATLWSEPKTFREAAGEDFNTAEVTSAPSACRQRLEKFAVVTPMPRLIGPGSCGGTDIVRMDAVIVAGKNVEMKPAPYLQCPMAEQLALWVRDDTTPLLAAIGGVLKSLETYDDFSCRGRNRKLFGKVSEHGKANAIDLKGFTLQDGRYVHLTDMKADKPLREGARKSACTRFMTVLGPGSDGYHEEHIHIDLAERKGDYRLCQWDVREPPPPPPPKVPEKPADKPEEIAAAKPESSRPQVAAVPPAPDDDDDDEKVAMTMVSPIRGVIPLPKPRPSTRTVRRKPRDLFHLPFNLLR